MLKLVKTLLQTTLLSTFMCTATLASPSDEVISSTILTQELSSLLDSLGVITTIPIIEYDVMTHETTAYVLQDILHLADCAEDFCDVADASQYAGAIGAVVEAGIMTRVDDSFGYGEVLTADDLEDILINLADYYANLSYEPFKAAVLEFNPQMYQLEQNIDALCAELEALFQQDVKFVVAPEMSTTGYSYTSRDDIAPYVDTLPGLATDKIAQLTSQYDAYVVFGLAEVDEYTDLYYNSAALVGPDGYIGKYRKLHQYEADEHWAAWGDIEMPVFATDIGNIAINICMDATYFESARLAAVNGADILAFPTNSGGRAIWNLPARAMQNGLFIVSANRSNEEEGFHMVGASAIWSPYGEKLVETDLTKFIANGVSESTALIAEIDTALYQNSNKDLLLERRPELYKDLSLYIAPWNSTKSTLSQSVTAAALQYEPSSDIESTKAVIEELFQHIDDTKLVVLPELSLTGTDLGSDVVAYADEAVLFAQQLAVEYNTTIIIGAVEEDDGILYNSAFLVDYYGDLVGVYRKTHLSEADKLWATAGDELAVFTVDGIGKIGMLIGEDVCFPEAAGVLAVLRADVIAIPSAWYGQYGGYMEINSAMSAREFPQNAMVLWDSVAQNCAAYTIVANFIGTDLDYLGSSALNTIDPLYNLDQPLAASRDQAEVLHMEFDTLQLDANMNQDKLQASRRTAFYNTLIME